MPRLRQTRFGQTEKYHGYPEETQHARSLGRSRALANPINQDD